MKISLYNTTSEPERVTKKLTLLTAIDEAKITSGVDLLSAKVILKRDIVSDVNAINYVYIDAFKRYYFATVTIENGFIILNCEVDVLYTYKNEILNLSATVTRNENKKNGYLVDKDYEVFAYEQVVCKSFTRGLTNNSIILMTVG